MVAEGQNPEDCRLLSAVRLRHGRAHLRLAGAAFGKSNLFIDIDNVPFGVDFRKHIDDALQTSDLLIAVVGHNWVGSQADGKSRIMNAADPVRVELETRCGAISSSFRCCSTAPRCRTRPSCPKRSGTNGAPSNDAPSNGTPANTPGNSIH